MGLNVGKNAKCIMLNAESFMQKAIEAFCFMHLAFSLKIINGTCTTKIQIAINLSFPPLHLQRIWFPL
jgi:hypothetical protein